MTTSCLPFDPEACDRRVSELIEDLGGTSGYIGEVTLGPAIREARRPGTRTVKVPRPPPAAANAEAAEASRKPSAGWAMREIPCSGPAVDRAGALLLLGKVHRQHLAALAAVAGDAVAVHARGMLFAGCTYGLLPDPVSNAVANALWYDATFPPSSSSCRDEVRVRALSAKAVLRMACRSLDALVAFVRSYAPTLSTAEVWSCLAAADGNLQLAVRLLRKRGVQCASQVEAFRAAVLAADLPNEAVREAHLSFVTSCDSVRSLLADHDEMIISSSVRESVHQISHISLPEPEDMGAPGMRDELASTSTASPASLSPPADRALRHKMHSFRMEEELSLAIAHMALQKLALQLGEPYELHMVCGKNYVILPPKCYHHINFLASPKGGSSPPTLFFAEVRCTLKDVNDVTVCCPLTENNGRCFVCDYGGVKLIHPADHEFNGVEDPGDCSLIQDPTTVAFRDPLNEDYMFFELDQQPHIATFLEDNYSYMNDDQVDLCFMWC
ncbi:hypothetical protein ACP70R_005229 [Stipagrostis hirtigluma subsp. patula]